MVKLGIENIFVPPFFDVILIRRGGKDNLKKIASQQVARMPRLTHTRKQCQKK